MKGTVRKPDFVAISGNQKVANSTINLQLTATPHPSRHHDPRSVSTPIKDQSSEFRSIEST